MEQIAASHAEMPSVLCVREVRVEVAYERLAEVQRFYTDLLGLRPWPDSQQIPGGWGAGHLQRGLYLQYRHDPTVDPLRHRFTLVVPALKAIIERLEEHDWPFLHYRGLSGIDQWLLITDPVGHLIEVRQSHRWL